ncbi:MAG: hypothetical protein QGG64_10135 [Candidatus Latescibacteria bacterium]|nr:hypothetical protein [Candidatus Latescibacterota bacterium]
MLFVSVVVIFDPIIMIALVLNIVFSIGFFHIIRVAQVKGRNMMVVAAVNYVLASSMCFGFSALSGNTALSQPTLIWGVVQGVMFIATYVLICTSMSLRGMAIGTAILRLSVVIPVLASVFYWGEVPSIFQVLGIGACLVALPLICTRAEGQAVSQTRLGIRGVLSIGLLFVGMGIASIASKAFIEADVPDAHTTFMGVLYGVAGLGAFVSFILPTWRESWSGLGDGVKLAFVNVLGILTFLVALDEVAGVIAFPVQAVGGLLLNTLFAAWVWRERFVRRTLVGMGVLLS